LVVARHSIQYIAILAQHVERLTFIAFIALSLVGMAGGNKGNWKQDKKAKGGKQKKDIIPKFKYFAKNALAAYPDEDGVPIYLNNAEDEKEFFKKGHIMKGRNKDNCELFKRMGMALCLGASSLDAGCKTLEKRVPKPNDSDSDIATKTKKGGLGPLVQLLDTAEGKEFVDAVGTLNAGQKKKPRKDDVLKAVRNMEHFLDEKGADLRKILSRVAIFSGSMFLFSMTLTELLELSEHKKDWAKSMDNVNKQPKAVRDWIRDPKDNTKFLNALAESFMEKIKKNKKVKDKKKNASDSSSHGGSSGSKDSENSGSDGCDDNSSDDKGKKKKGKKNVSDSSSSGKDKKKSGGKKDSGKKNKNASDSSSSGKAKKKKKKESGDKTDNKKRKRLSSSSSEKNHEKDKKKTKLEEKEASFTQMNQGEVQILLASCQTMLPEIGSRADGKFPKDKLLELTKDIPETLLVHFPAVVTLLAEVKAKTEDMVGNDLARKVVTKVTVLASQMEEFFESNMGKATASSSV
jgi:hypothetical protein